MAKSNPFAMAQQKREEEQANIKKNLGMKSIEMPEKEPERISKRKVRLDVTVPQATKDKLIEYAEKQGLSASVAVQILIDKACETSV